MKAFVQSELAKPTGNVYVLTVFFKFAATKTFLVPCSFVHAEIQVKNRGSFYYFSFALHLRSKINGM